MSSTVRVLFQSGREMDARDLGNGIIHLIGSPSDSIQTSLNKIAISFSASAVYDYVPGIGVPPRVGRSQQ